MTLGETSREREQTHGVCRDSRWSGQELARDGVAGSPEGCAPPPRFQEDASGSSSELGGGLASASPPRPPGPPDSSWHPGSPQLPRICCLGLFALPQPEPTVLPLKHRVPGAPQSALCAAETHSVVCVCSARGLRATSSPPLHVPPPMSRWLSPAAPRTPCLGGGRDQGPKAAAPGAVAGPSPAGQAGDSLGASRPAREPGSAWAEASLCCQYAQVTCKYYAVL